MTTYNAFYAQSGGVTAVINASAAGLIKAIRAHPDKIANLYAGRFGILGALQEELIDVNLEQLDDLDQLCTTPGGAFGSCRYKLKSFDESRADYERIIAVFKAHNIKYFFYNGGNDSQDTTQKLSEIAEQLGYPLVCIGIPKTIDNDLMGTDNCPGFGSVAKYVAVSIREAGLDVASMASNSTKVFIMEVMGRHAGWIAASAGLASSDHYPAPHIILFPEVPFDRDKFLHEVQACVERYGYCTVVASEGIRDGQGQHLTQGSLDAFGHAQLGGVAPLLAHMVSTRLKLKNHWAVADYLQRSAAHIASKTDVDQAFALGHAAVELALAGQQAIMVNIERLSDEPYRWQIGHCPLSQAANHEKTLPMDFIRSDGFHITERCRTYLMPLINGESYPKYVRGLPDYAKLSHPLLAKKCPPYPM